MYTLQRLLCKKVAAQARSALFLQQTLTSIRLTCCVRPVFYDRSNPTRFPWLLTPNTMDAEKRKIPDRRTHKCLFCDAYVYNFATHLQRKHSSEEQVKEILALDKTDFNRKRMIGRLRKEGNFYAGDVVPVQIKKTQMLEANSCGLMPCTHCKGYYARKSLRRHVQRCSFNKSANSTVRKHQCDGHTLMSRHFDPNDVLRTSGVLRSLKPDEISLVAKKDAVVCEVAREYVKYNTGKAFLSMVNRHMRVLARLLIEARRIEKDDALSLLSILHPSKFKTIVKATQIICGYDPVKRAFNVPTLAPHMGTLVRRALNAANSMEAQDGVHSFSLDELNATRRLFNEKWTKELSTESFDLDLDENGLVKPRVISITQDLVKLKTYTDNLILKAKLELQSDAKNHLAYRTLIEGSYCRMLLFNDQSMSEIEQISLELYCNHENDRVVDILEELLLTKKTLLQCLKHFEINGNNVKNGVVLIDKLTEEAMDLVLEYRQHFYETNNQYLFGLPGSDIGIDGYDTFKKHFIIALGDRNDISLFTSKRFRQHLATISQILQMNSDELKQLQRSMGYTITGYTEYNNQPLDVEKIAKLSKMVLFCGNNCPSLYKGCDLDDVDLGNDLIEIDEFDDNEDSEREQTEKCEGSSENEQKSLITVRKDKKMIRRMWTHEEKRIADGHFKKHIEEKLVPKKKEVLQFMEIYKQLFKHRRWETIKAYVCNKSKQ
ncbi:hypothetical protein AMK59_2398 [Oryctes borbonicus]|uniref:Uncharacterized protein n=1 Tax=Oryctes borbonicus TaxID=1629725 RepID=A0A0T6BBY0_9SCAR|nr:hypothetical protein AMK59_2398 [Oryctes borbonicus]